MYIWDNSLKSIVDSELYDTYFNNNNCLEFVNNNAIYLYYNKSLLAHLKLLCAGNVKYTDTNIIVNLFKILSINANDKDKIKSLINIFSTQDNINLDFGKKNYLKDIHYIQENILFNLVFIVRDLEGITSRIEGANPGPQKNRGQVDSLTRRLCYIDQELFESMLRHAVMLRPGTFHKEQFTNKNLHINIGFSRY